MNRISRLMGVCALSVLAPALASAAIFSDSFPTGVNGGIWEATPGNALDQVHVGDTAHVLGGAGDQSAKQVDADPFIYYMHTKSGVITAPSVIPSGQAEILTVYMYDDGAFTTGYPGPGQNTQPISAGVMLATDAAGDFAQISVNSAAAGGYGFYNWRTQAQGTFSTGVARTQGWHKFQIELDPYTGSNDVKFSIDGVQVATGNRNSANQSTAFNQIRLGLSVKTYAPFWYDNVDLSVTPEPASLLLLVPALALVRRRRGVC